MKKKVLVIDDDYDIVQAATIILTLQGFDVRAHYTGENIEEVITEFNPNLILLDVWLPNARSGTDICKKIKKEYSIPIILFSTDIGVAFKECEADDFIHKPFDLNDFIKVVNAHL